MCNNTLDKIKFIRNVTGVGIMECKSVLTDCNGDINKTIKKLKRNSILKGINKSSKKTGEGIIVFDINNFKNKGVILELSCETDFVSKNIDFINYAKIISKLILKYEVSSFEMLKNFVYSDNFTIEEKRLDLISRYNENIFIRRLKVLSGLDNSIFGYVHGMSIGSILIVKNLEKHLSKDIAMHIVAMSPKYINKKDIPNSVIVSEKKLYLEEILKLYPNKNDKFVERIIKGKINKYIDKIVLMEQNFIKIPKLKVKDVVKNIYSVLNFVYLKVGEII